MNGETSDFETTRGQPSMAWHSIRFSRLTVRWSDQSGACQTYDRHRRHCCAGFSLSIRGSSMMDTTMCHQTLGVRSPFVSISKEERWQRVFWRILEKKKKRGERIHYHLSFFTLIIKQSFNTSRSTKLLPTEDAFGEVRMNSVFWEIDAFSGHSSLLIFLVCFTSVWSSLNVGTLTNQFGRISNMANDQIHVSASLTLSECVRQCADFSHYYLQYSDEECYAYNYDTNEYTCELIHSKEPLNYFVTFQTQWMTGLKQQAWFVVLSLINKLLLWSLTDSRWYARKRPFLFCMSTG